MAKRVTVTTELTAAELHKRYRSATNTVERTHWHILWLMKEGHSPNEVASLLGYTARWIRTIVGRYNRGLIHLLLFLVCQVSYAKIESPNGSLSISKLVSLSAATC